MLIANLFNDYFDIGGFPEVIKTGYMPLLQEYFQNIIFRDIIMRFKIKHEFSLRELAGFLATNIGKSFRFSENNGKKLENQIYYGYDGFKEIDFIICKNSKIVELAQCCYEIEGPETRERELKSLIKALTFYKMKEGSIYTFDFEGEEQVEGMLIKYIPAWKLSLEKNPQTIN